MVQTRGSALLVAALISACSSDEVSRPPQAGGGCLETDCLRPTITGPSVGLGGQVDAGTTGDESGDASVDVRLDGEIRVFSGSDVSSVTDFRGSGIVGADGPLDRVTSSFNGIRYAVDGVIRDTSVWTDLEATTTTLDVVPTIQNVDTTQPPVDLAFVRGGVLEDIGANLLRPEIIQSDRAQVILRFVDGSGRGVAGVRLTDAAGVVAYDAGDGLYRDDLEETESSGGAVVLNVQGGAFPGTTVPVGFGGAAAGTVEVRLAAGAATVMTIRI